MINDRNIELESYTIYKNSLNQNKVTIMAKGKDTQKEVKKKPEKSLKEKRAAKKEKKSQK